MHAELDDGIIKSLHIGDTVYIFRSEEEHCGPVFHVCYTGQERIGSPMKKESEGWYGVSFWGVELAQRVIETESGLRIEARMANRSSQVFRPDRVSLVLGIDSYMDRYPEWNDKLFPTMLRCEKTHMWGYFRTPSGKILGIASPDPIASWSLDYNHFFCDSGHRVYTARLDLISMDKQPERHPVIDRLLPGEERRIGIELFDAASVEDVIRKCSAICHAPMFYAEKLILEEDETAEVRIFTETEPLTSEGKAIQVSHDEWRVRLPGKRCGLYELKASANGRTASANWYVRKPWSFYLDAARQAAYDNPQKTGSHCESWYGFFSAFEAARRIPKPELDAKLLKRFEELLPLSFDADRGVPISIEQRIQNTAIAVSLCEDAWRMTHDEKWLDRGARFADFLIDRCQNTDGVFCSDGGHYTCVIYIAKSILELYLAERELPQRKAAAEKHFRAAKRAVDELVRNRDNIGTEGEHTFEDGMISCSVLQIAMLALLLKEEERAPYIEAAEELLEKHRCLERLGSIDARSRNTTIRFWEAQYDVLIPANMLNSPHGWSGWKVYGVWYLYLLTGKTQYLIDTMETLGSCMQLIDPSGKLRWSFVPDPCIRAGLWKPDPDGGGYLERCTFGETYIDMISGWYHAPESRAVFGYLGDYPGFETDEGGCCDNDVHECFKALAEAALPYAYIYRNGGETKAYNGHFEDGVFVPAETIVHAVHINLDRPETIRIRFADGIVESVLKTGWLHRDGHVTSSLPNEMQ